MPELDSHRPSAGNPTPLESTYSPWHACGADYGKYSAAMRRCSHLRLVSATCRLSPGQTDTGAAAQQWQDLFGVERQGDDLVFTNARLKFVSGVNGLPEGLESITIEVSGKEKLDRMLDVVSKERLCGDGWTNLLGIKWYFVLAEDLKEESKTGIGSKL